MVCNQKEEIAIKISVVVTTMHGEIRLLWSWHTLYYFIGGKCTNKDSFLQINKVFVADYMASVLLAAMRLVETLKEDLPKSSYKMSCNYFKIEKKFKVFHSCLF
jgi:hypothetical protein